MSRAAGEVRIMRGSSVARRARSLRCCPITAGSSLFRKERIHGLFGFFESEGGVS